MLNPEKRFQMAKNAVETIIAKGRLGVKDTFIIPKKVK